jgi:hypothetical protein
MDHQGRDPKEASSGKSKYSPVFCKQTALLICGGAKLHVLRPGFHARNPKNTLGLFTPVHEQPLRHVEKLAFGPWAFGPIEL